MHSSSDDNQQMVRIDDYDNPALPLPLRLFNSVGYLCPSRFPSVDVLLSMAIKRSRGLTNFGDEGFMEPLSVLVHSLQTETPLTAFGRFLQKESIVGCLVQRLRLEELYRAHPDISDESISQPIIIAGLPRTGTTHLFNLLSRDGSLHYMPYWETLNPFPEPNEASPEGRVKVGGQALQLIGWCMPKFAAFHEFHNDWPHEELQLLTQSFISLSFEAAMLVPSYSKWYRQADRSPAYAYLKRSLKALQWLRKREGNTRRRWVLKCPEHLANIKHLVQAFPDATFVQTHRDPARIVASMSAMVAYSARMNMKAGTARDMANHWSERTEDLLLASVRDRNLLPEAKVVDVRFYDFMNDMRGTVKRIFNRAGHDYTDATDRAIDAFLANNPPGKHGRIDYQGAMDDLGIEERGDALFAYSKMFSVLYGL